MAVMLSQHTAPVPPISLEAAAAALETFGDQVSALLAFEQRRRVTPEIEAVALAFLTYMFTPLRPELEENYRAAFESAGLVMRHASDATRQRFLEEVVLNCVHPDDVKRFSKMIRATIPAERVSETLRHHAAIGNDLHLYNSFWLLHYMHASDEVVLAIAAQLVGRPTTNPHVREAATVTLRLAAGTNVTGT
jgi:hypothetical protein